MSTHSITGRPFFSRQLFSAREWLGLTDGRWRWQGPAWLGSLVLHALLVVLLGYVAAREVHGTGALVPAELIVTTSTDSIDGRYFEDEANATVGLVTDPQPVNDGASGTAIAEGELSAIFGDAPPVDSHWALPSRDQPSGLGGGQLGQATAAGELTKGAARSARVTGGKARTTVYGVEGEGHKFVYVFDRSASMGGSGHSPLEAAKGELLLSLKDLGETNEFQIIFYNERPTVMQLGGRPGALVFGTDLNKDEAEHFVQGITANGGTRHEDALLAAFKLRPDVVFFLTDADQPELSPAQLARIAKRNGGQASVHTIEFGLGPKVYRDNFLSKLAWQNGGQYVYIDISKQGALDRHANRP